MIGLNVENVEIKKCDGYWEIYPLLRVRNVEILRCIELNERRLMLKHKIIINKRAYDQLLRHVCCVNFQYETGGIVLGYKCLRMFYIVAFTFPQTHKNADRMRFTLNGKEHMREIEKIEKKFVFQPQFLGVWHSHTTEDISFSLQDQKSNELLANQFGEIISIIVIQKKKAFDIKLSPYYITRNRQEFLHCKYE